MEIGGGGGGKVKVWKGRCVWRSTGGGVCEGLQGVWGVEIGGWVGEGVEGEGCVKDCRGCGVWRSTGGGG